MQSYASLQFSFSPNQHHLNLFLFFAYFQSPFTRNSVPLIDLLLHLHNPCSHNFTSSVKIIILTVAFSFLFSLIITSITALSNHGDKILPCCSLSFTSNHSVFLTFVQTRDCDIYAAALLSILCTLDSFQSRAIFMTLLSIEQNYMPSQCQLKQLQRFFFE